MVNFITYILPQLKKYISSTFLPPFPKTDSSLVSLWVLGTSAPMTVACGGLRWGGAISPKEPRTETEPSDAARL